MILKFCLFNLIFHLSFKLDIVSMVFNGNTVCKCLFNVSMTFLVFYKLVHHLIEYISFLCLLNILFSVIIWIIISRRWSNNCTMNKYIMHRLPTSILCIFIGKLHTGKTCDRSWTQILHIKFGNLRWSLLLKTRKTFVMFLLLLHKFESIWSLLY